MNIDISNAHCGPRILFLDHSWLRVVSYTKTARFPGALARARETPERVGRATRRLPARGEAARRPEPRERRTGKTRTRNDRPRRTAAAPARGSAT